MKIKLLFFLFSFFILSIQSQQLFFEFNKTSSTFDYKNSQGQGLTNILPKSNNNMGIGYRFPAIKNKLSVVIGLSYNNYGAIGSDQILDNFYEWDITYAGLNVGFDYKLLEMRDLLFSFKTNLSTEFLVQGAQTLNNQVFNLVGEDEFNQSLFFVNAGLTMQYPISDKASIYAQYMFGKSFTVFKENSIDNEKLNIFAHGIGIGIIVKLPNSSCYF